MSFTPAERESLYRELQPLVRRLTRQYGEDPELHQELPGEIYCRFCTLLDAYDPSRGVPLRPYLVRALTASVYTFARSHWRRQRREITVEADVEGNESGPSIDPTASWDRDLMTQEVLKALPAAIEKLPLRQRQVVTGRFYEARSFDDIAATLGVCPATARSLLRHGLNNLRRHLARTGLAWE
jgi:RNA polymerase sigma factor (sigma-70 family)